MYVVLINNTYLTSFDTIEEAEEYVEECEYDDLVNYYKIVYNTNNEQNEI